MNSNIDDKMECNIGDNIDDKIGTDCAFDNYQGNHNGSCNKKVRFNDDVVVHEVRRLYTKNMWIGMREVEANIRAILKAFRRH